MDDRRGHDPFAPPPPVPVPPRNPPPETPPSRSAPAVGPPETDDVAMGADDGMGGMRRADLVAVAEREGIPAQGTRDALITRIRRARAGQGE